MAKSLENWYRKIVEPLLTYTPQSGSTTELKQLLSLDPAEVDLALLAADINRTQEYVFESVKLPGIRGGSMILTRLDKALEQFLLGEGLPPKCVLSAAGGSLLSFVPASIANDLATKIELIYSTETSTVTMTCVWRPVTPNEVLGGLLGRSVLPDHLARLMVEDRQRIQQSFDQSHSFGELVRAIGIELRKRKESPNAAPIVESLSFAVRCRICRIRPADRMYRYFDEDWPMCDVCRRKVRVQMTDVQDDAGQGHGRAKDARSDQVDQYLEQLPRLNPALADRYWGNFRQRHVWVAQDLEELGQACLSRPGYVGFIYADGNSMGKQLESLPTPAAYHEFSETLKRAISESVYEALAENLHPTVVDRKAPTGKPLGRGPIHPFEIVFVGGDDVMLIVPADAALPVAVRMCQLFEEKMQIGGASQLQLQTSKRPTLSAGIVIAECHNPVRVLRDTAKELCKNAKHRCHKEERAKRGTTSVVDFLVIKSQSMLRQKVKQLRNAPPYYFSEGGARIGRYLTAAPYTLQEAQRLLQILKLLRQIDVPINQLQSLVAALQRGRQYGSVHYLYQRARLAARLGETRKEQNMLARLPEVWPYDKDDPIPWHRVPGHEDESIYASIVPDLLELYPYVPKIVTNGLWNEIVAEVAHAN